MSQTAEAAAPAVAQPPLHLAGIVKHLADGTKVPATDPRTDHVAISFPDGRTYHVVSLGKATYEQAIRLCADLDVLGHKDWHLASPKDWLANVIDYDRHDPAVDPNLFPGIKPTWHWAFTNKGAAWASGDAWYVSAYSGGVNTSNRNGAGFALAVRGAGQ